MVDRGDAHGRSQHRARGSPSTLWQQSCTINVAPSNAASTDFNNSMGGVEYIGNTTGGSARYQIPSYYGRVGLATLIQTSP